MEDMESEGEQRFASIGRDAVGKVLVVVYTHRDEEIRLISARHATPTETRMYEEGV